MEGKRPQRRYQTFVFDDSNVKNEIAAITEIFNTDYKLLGLGFTDDPAGDIASSRKRWRRQARKRCMRRCKNRHRLLIRPTAADEKILPGQRGRGKGSAPAAVCLVGGPALRRAEKMIKQKSRRPL